MPVDEDAAEIIYHASNLRANSLITCTFSINILVTQNTHPGFNIFHSLLQ